MILDQLAEVLKECPDETSALASTTALLHDAFDHWTWVGFYRPEKDGTLVVGPYQGALACIRLPAGQGVCGRAFSAGRTVVVPDVSAFEGHIACDPRTRSEIVVPLVAGDRVVAVLDVDSDQPAAFGADDRALLESVAAQIVNAVLFRGHK